MYSIYTTGGLSCTHHITHHSGVHGHAPEVVVLVLHLSVDHELDGAVGNAEHAGQKTSVQAFQSLVTVRLRQTIFHSPINKYHRLYIFLPNNKIVILFS